MANPIISGFKSWIGFNVEHNNPILSAHLDDDNSTEPPPPAGSFIITEAGDFITTEDGGFLVTQS